MARSTTGVQEATRQAALVRRAIVHLIDDDASFLKATARFLQASGYEVETYSTPPEFLDKLPTDQPGCVVLDLQMPGMNGFEIQKAIVTSRNPLPVIFLTGRGDIPATVQAMRAGAEDFLTKLATKEQLLSAVERALARDARERKERIRQEQLRKRFECLTQRERQVLTYVFRGAMNKEIAAQLGLNERTVKLHRAGINLKIGVRSVAELMDLAHQAGLVAGKRLNFD